MTHERIVTKARGVVAPSLEPGERDHAVLRGWIGIDRRLFVLLAIGGIAAVALWAFPRSSPPPFGDLHPWYVHEMRQLELRWAGFAAIVVAESLAIARWSPTRWLVVTDRRLLIFSATFSGSRPRSLVTAAPIDDVRAGAIRPRFPVQGNFGLATAEGVTMDVGFVRSWRPAVERMTAALDPSSPVPRRPDVAPA